MSNKESLFYHQLSNLLDAGITLPDAIQSLIPESPQSLRKKLNQVYQSLQAGEIPVTAFTQAGFGKMELAMIEVAEQTGNLTGCFRQLQQHTERMEHLRAKLKAGLAYPLFLLFVAPALLNLYLLFQSNLLAYLSLLLKSYSLWIGIALGGYAIHSVLRSNYAYNLFLNQLPVIGKIRSRFALARFTNAMAQMLEGGMLAPRALQLASEASNNLVYERQLESAYSTLRNGSSLSEALAVTQVLPTLPMQMIRTGETSGRLVESFQHLSKITLDEADQQLQLFAKIFPLLCYFAIAFYVGYQIVIFYGGYLNRIMTP